MKRRFFFESPHRMARTLSELAEMAPDRMVLVARELTKKFEELFRGPLKDAARHFAEVAPRGEFTVVLSPPKKADLKMRKRVALSREEE